MILVDSRVGSRELLTDIRHLGCDAEIVVGLATDFQWTGEGPDGAVLVGVERKAIGYGKTDLLDSIRSNRLSGGQVGRALDCYDYYHLIVEGPWRRGEGGRLEVGFPWHEPKGNFKYAEVIKFLNGLSMLGDVRLWRTFNEEETVATLVDWHDQWQKPWDEHTSGKVIYAPGPSIQRRSGNKMSFFPSEATPVQKWLYQLPGMGDKKTIDLAPKFKVPGEIANFTNWSILEGIGKIGANKIWEWIHG